MTMDRVTVEDIDERDLPEHDGAEAARRFDQCHGGIFMVVGVTRSRGINPPSTVVSAYQARATRRVP
jgi:hypothetical protein